MSTSWAVLISVDGFDAGVASVEQIDGPDITSVNTLAALDTVGIATLPGFDVRVGGTFTYTFPAHSITAIDIAAADPTGEPGTVT